MSDLLDRINNGEILIADGAMGTQLAERGVDITGCVEKINFTHPEILEEIAFAYLDAGAEIIQANTFGASPLKLSMHGYEDQAEEVITAAVKAVRKVIGQKAFLSGSCGPSGKLLKPYGDCEPDDMFDSYKRQMKSFSANGIDIVCVETMTDLAEATLAVKAAREIMPDIPISATMTFDPTPRGFYTVMGVTIQQAIDGLLDAGADIVGSNCGNGIDNMIKIAEEFKQLTDKPIIIQSNAGLPEIKEGKLFYSESPDFMADKAEQLKVLGISIIGGCCGTTPDHIRAIKSRIKS